MTLLVHNIRTLVHTENKPVLKFSGKDMSTLECMDHAYLLIEGEHILDFGKEEDGPISAIQQKHKDLELLDAGGGMVFPSWVDSHTHLVFAGSREGEFVDRIHGRSYEEIASRGGGILNSARLLHETSEEELFRTAMQRLEEIMWMGTGAVEIKSGYGLSVESELKMLRVIKKLKANSPLTIRSTFLGAHAVPAAYKNDKGSYIDMLIHELMPMVSAEKLADYCDVFCEQNYFSKTETIRILESARAHGMIAKVHAEQLSHSGGIEAGVQCQAISVDHLEFANDEDIRLLKNSRTMPVLLPGAQLFLGLQSPPARKMIDAGCPVALSSDYNPGSCPSGNMNQMVSLACILYKMSPEEAIKAATTNSAYAIQLSETHGSIARGKRANVFITGKISSYAFLPYAFGSNLIEQVILNGKVIQGKNS